MARLIIMQNGRFHGKVELLFPVLRVGRDNGNDVVLPDRRVSRFHAEIRLEGAEYHIADLNSQNGTWINGRRVGQQLLEPGSVVRLEPYELRFETAASWGSGTNDKS